MLTSSRDVVPNGGYITSLFYTVARTHMRTTHPGMHAGSPDPITVHLSFLRRTEAGPATFTVQDTKLGSRTSTLHITLSQKNPDGSQRDEVAGYITVSNMSAETGPSMNTRFALTPAPVKGSGPDGSVDLGALTRTGRDGVWERFEVPLSSMRHATKHIEFFAPKASAIEANRGFVEQWVRFKPYGKLGRWTDASLGFLVDMFPMMLETFDEQPWDKGAKKQETQKFWYPTVLLNVEYKKRLPEEGAEWLYSRVFTKVLRNGRMDLDIVVLDAAGEVVALSNHVALIMGAERNLAKRNGNGGNKGGKL